MGTDRFWSHLQVYCNWPHCLALDVATCDGHVKQMRRKDTVLLEGFAVTGLSPFIGLSQTESDANSWQLQGLVSGQAIAAWVYDRLPWGVQLGDL